jgi:hypothetical protein
VAEITVRTRAQVVETGEDGKGRPSVTLGISDNDDILLRLASIDECRALAPALLSKVDVTITIAVPGGRHG